MKPEAVLGELEGLRALARSLVHGDAEADDRPRSACRRAPCAGGSRPDSRGIPVAPLGVEGAVAKIRGAAGTTVAITLRCGDQTVQLVVQRRKLHA